MAADDNKDTWKLYSDGGVQFRKDLEATGFKDIKIWEQPINLYFEDGDDYVAKFGGMSVGGLSQRFGVDQEELKKETIKVYNELSDGTLKTFQVAVVLAFKE